MGMDIGTENYQGQMTQTIDDGNRLQTLDEKIKYSNNQDYQNVNLNYDEQGLNLINDNILQETNVNSFNEIEETQNIYPDTQATETQVFPTSFIMHDRNQESSNFLENTDLDQYIQNSTATPKFNDSPQEQNINIQENNGIEYSNLYSTHYLQQTEYIGVENNNGLTNIQQYVEPNTVYEKVSNFVSNKVNDAKDAVENVKDKVTNVIPNKIQEIGDTSKNYIKNTIDGANFFNPIGGYLGAPAILGANALMKGKDYVKEGIKGTVGRAFCNNNVPTIIKIEDEEKIPICPDFICKIYKSIFG